MFNWLKKNVLAKKTAPQVNVPATQNAESAPQSASSESEILKNQGDANLEKGMLENAAKCYRRAIEHNPRYAEAYANLGLICQATGNFSEAVEFYRKAVAYDPDLLPAHQNLGVVLMMLGEVDAAEESFRQAIAISPGHTSALQHLGVIAGQRGDFQQAEAFLHRALELQPDSVDTHNNLGNLLMETRRLPEAEASYRRALELKPDNATAHYNLGVLLMETKRPPEAEASYRRALELKPDYPEAHNNLGAIMLEQERLDEAAASFRYALNLKPDYAEAHNNLGFTLLELGQLDEAEASCRKALQVRPNFASAHKNLGIIIRKQGRTEEAMESFLQALQFEPYNAEAHSSLGIALMELGKREEARTSFSQALLHNPNIVEARWSLTMAQVPAVAGTHEEIEASRAKYLDEIDELKAWFDNEKKELGYQAVGIAQPFFLAYQEENNRDFLLQYGTLCTQLMEFWQDRQTFHPSRVVSDDSVRVGIVSAHIHHHSVWDAIIKGWFLHFDQSRINLHIFHVGLQQDDETNWAASQSASFERGPKRSGQWAETIIGKQVDILIYPEIGMDPMTAKLASMRLAPIQIATWGHPETTGLPTIDYYLSGECLEPPEAQEYYTEHLICLPHLGCHYQPAENLTILTPNFPALGITTGIPLFLCPGTPFKYAPQHDHVLVEIAQKLDRCQFVFFTYHKPYLSEKLRNRLRLAFSSAGMNFDDYSVFIPWQNKASFYGLMKQADVFLDTIGFSGFNTAMQAIECGLPIVSKEGRFMRGRLASGILKRMGLEELIANTADEYVNLAVKLAQDSEYRLNIHQRIETSRLVLFNDVAPVRALEDFLVGLAKTV